MNCHLKAYQAALSSDVTKALASIAGIGAEGVRAFAETLGRAFAVNAPSFDATLEIGRVLYVGDEISAWRFARAHWSYIAALAAIEKSQTSAAVYFLLDGHAATRRLRGRRSKLRGALRELLADLLRSIDPSGYYCTAKPVAERIATLYPATLPVTCAGGVA
jgi:hypothetical protein